MQCIEHIAAQWIAKLRVQKPENAPFLPSENRFPSPSRACIFVPAKLAIFREISLLDLVISEIIYNFVTVVIFTTVIKYEVL